MLNFVSSHSDRLQTDRQTVTQRQREKKKTKQKKLSEMIFTDHISTFSEQGSFLITSGAIHATVPVNVIFALFSDIGFHVPKSEIFNVSFCEIRMLVKDAKGL